MTQTLKERADEILLYQAMDVEGAFEVGDFQSIEQYHSESQALIRDQQSRIEELEKELEELGKTAQDCECGIFMS